MSFAQQDIKKVEFYEEYGYLRISIILLTVKVFYDIIFGTILVSLEENSRRRVISDWENNNNN